MELAAFLPMVRVTGNITEVMADPAHKDKMQPFIDALNQRLPFARYIYSQMFAANFTGGSIVYPIYFDYTSDRNALYTSNETYMLGGALKVSPVLGDMQGETTFDSYFP